MAGRRPRRPLRRLDGITPQLAERAREDVRTTVQSEALHPSIIAWNLTNEMAGNGHPGGQAQYVEAMSQWLHAYDPARMVAVDVWGEHPPRHGAGPLYSDVDAVSETDYSGWYEGLHDKPAKLRQLIDGRLAAMNATFPGKVQIISEFGAEGNPLNRPGARQLRLPDAPAHPAHPPLRGRPALSGMLVWVLRDFALTPTYYGGSVLAEDPHIKLIEGILGKGLFNYAGHPKPAGAVARLFKALPTGRRRATLGAAQLFPPAHLRLRRPVGAAPPLSLGLTRQALETRHTRTISRCQGAASSSRPWPSRARRSSASSSRQRAVPILVLTTAAR